MFRKPIALALCCAAASAGAADNGFYVGFGAAQSKFDLPGASDDQDNGFKGIVGFRALDSFGVELNYADHGKATTPSAILCGPLPCPQTVSVGAKTLSAFAVGFLDFPLLDLFAKAGLSSWKIDVSAPVVGVANFTDKDTDFAWGAGVQAHFGSLGARAEYERF